MLKRNIALILSLFMFAAVFPFVGVSAAAKTPENVAAGKSIEDINPENNAEALTNGTKNNATGTEKWELGVNSSAYGRATIVLDGSYVISSVVVYSGMSDGSDALKAAKFFYDGGDGTLVELAGQAVDEMDAQNGGKRMTFTPAYPVVASKVKFQAAHSEEEKSLVRIKEIEVYGVPVPEAAQTSNVAAGKSIEDINPDNNAAALTNGTKNNATGTEKWELGVNSSAYGRATIVLDGSYVISSVVVYSGMADGSDALKAAKFFYDGGDGTLVELAGQAVDETDAQNGGKRMTFTPAYPVVASKVKFQAAHSEEEKSLVRIKEIEVYGFDPYYEEDAPPPVEELSVELTAPAHGAVVQPGADVSVRGTVSGAASIDLYDGEDKLDTMAQNGTYSYTIPAVAEGVHHLRLVATDAEGNTETAEASIIAMQALAEAANVALSRPVATIDDALAIQPAADNDGACLTDGTKNNPNGANRWALQRTDASYVTLDLGTKYLVNEAVIYHGTSSAEYLDTVEVSYYNDEGTLVPLDVLVTNEADSATNGEKMTVRWSPAVTADKIRFDIPAAEAASPNTRKVKEIEVYGVKPPSGMRVELTAPAHGAVVQPGTDVTVTGTITGAASAELYDGDTRLDTAQNGAYSYTIQAITEGVHHLRLVGTDADGITQTAEASILAATTLDGAANVAYRSADDRATVPMLDDSSYDIVPEDGTHGDALTDNTTNNPNLRWLVSKNTDAHVTLDLGAAYMINSVKIYSGMNDDSESVRNAAVSYYNESDELVPLDGLVTIAEGTGKGSILTVAWAPAVTARKVRVDIPAQDSQAKVKEIEVYGVKPPSNIKVELTAPAHGAVVQPGTDVTVTGTVSGATSVELYDGDTRLDTVTQNGAYSYTIPAITEGVHHLRLVATDAAGNSETAEASLLAATPLDGAANVAKLKPVATIDDALAIDPAADNDGACLTDGTKNNPNGVNRWVLQRTSASYVTLDLGTKYLVNEAVIYHGTSSAEYLDTVEVSYYNDEGTLVPLDVLVTNEADSATNGEKMTVRWSPAVAADKVRFDIPAAESANPNTRKVKEIEIYGIPAPVDAPDVAITSPADGTAVEAGSPITVTASAQYDKGAVTKSELYDGDTKLGDMTAAGDGTYTYTIAQAKQKLYRLTVRAYKDDTVYGESETVRVLSAASIGATTNVALGKQASAIEPAAANNGACLTDGTKNNPNGDFRWLLTRTQAAYVTLDLGTKHLVNEAVIYHGTSSGEYLDTVEVSYYNDAGELVPLDVLVTNARDEGTNGERMTVRWSPAVAVDKIRFDIPAAESANPNTRKVKEIEVYGRKLAVTPEVSFKAPAGDTELLAETAASLDVELSAILDYATIDKVELYVNGTLAHTFTGTDSLRHTLTLAPGTHTLTAKAYAGQSVGQTAKGIQIHVYTQQQVLDLVGGSSRSTIADNLATAQRLLGIDLTKLNALSEVKREKAYLKLINRSYNSKTELQQAIDKAVADVNSEGNGGGSGSGGGSSSGGGGGQTVTVPPSEPVIPTPPPQPQPVFDDLDAVPWAQEAIESLAEQGIVNGVGGGLFAPDDHVTREQFVKMLVGAFGLLDETASTDFTDVDTGSVFYPYIASAQAAGLTNGLGDGTFGMGADITREEMATLAYRAAALAGITLEADGSPDFADAADIAQYAAEAVAAMQQAGIINGMTETEFGPRGTATRAMAAKVVYLTMNQK